MIKSYSHHVIHHNIVFQPCDHHILPVAYHVEHPIPNMAITHLKPYESCHTFTVQSSEHDTMYLPDDDITQWVT